MTLTCHLRVLLAKVNVERGKQGKPALSLRRLAEECGVSLSVLASLNTGRSQRIDYRTIDQLLIYFNGYLHVTTNDLLVWEQPAEKDTSGQELRLYAKLYSNAQDAARAFGHRAVPPDAGSRRARADHLRQRPQRRDQRRARARRRGRRLRRQALQPNPAQGAGK